MPNDTTFVPVDASASVAELQRSINTLPTLLKGFADDVKARVGEFGARLDDIEQKLARRGSTGLPALEAMGGGRSLGQQVVANADFQSWLANGKPRGGGVRIPVGMGLAMISTSLGSGGALIPPDYRREIVEMPQRRMTIRGLLAPGRTTSKSVEYSKETVFTNAADVVSEGTQKPESDIQFEPATAPVRKIAHFVVASKEALDDAPGLTSMIDSTLRYGLTLKEEDQLLYGTGDGENLYGLALQATDFDPPFSPTSQQMLDDLGLAIAQSEAAELPATGIVINSLDWRRMTMLKDGQERYLGGGPFSPGPPTIWGLPAVPTNAMQEGFFLVGAFGIAAQIFDREDAVVLISTEDGSNFTTNKVTILAEERLALAVKRSQALIYGQFTNVTE